MGQGINGFLRVKEEQHSLRRLTEVTPLAGGKILISGREFINFSSNDYLGLAAHPKLIRAAREALFPAVGASASRLMTGSTVLHHTLEGRIAEFKRKPAALVFNSGYQANTGIISALCGKRDCIFSDRLNHASIIDGIRLSGARLFRFRHNDPGHLEELLNRERRKYRYALIVTETVFSMDGDIAPVEKIVRLKEKYDCMLMVDEAHATGIFGTGGGLLEETGMTDGVDVVMGTFGKALGGFGAYAAVSEPVRNYLINTCRSFIYSTALPPSIVAADLAAIDLIKEEPHRRKTLLSNTCYFRKRLEEEGVKAGGDSQIVSIITGGNKTAVRLGALLRDDGYWVTPVRPPTVPAGEARIRISLTFDHTREILDKFAKKIGAVYSDLIHSS